MPSFSVIKGMVYFRKDDTAWKDIEALAKGVHGTGRITMQKTFPHLFSEGQIGTLKLRNRSVMTAMGTGYGQADGCVTERELVFLTERARGGVGMIITGVTRIEESCGTSAVCQLSASDDKHIAGLKKLADSIHEAGGAIVGQLQHPGNTANPGFNKEVLSPSGIPAASGVPTRPLTLDEIHDLVKRFGAAALRLKKAGFDGVEVHGAHFYLIHQFLSPTYNQREDEYGGSSENRFRFLKEIVEEIRKTCGPDYPLIVRVSLEEYIGENGYHPDYGITICKRLEALGVDALDITASGSASPRGQSIEYMTYDQGWRRFLVKAVKRSVKIPVIGVCVIRDPAYAEEMLASCDVDFVGSARNYLADAEWVNKAAAGDTALIRRCISCLRCIENLKAGYPAYCSVNPAAGKEFEEKELQKDGNGRGVIVLGAGPGGMQAALIAAQRGFSVTLYEKEDHAGGQLALAAAVPGKAKMNWLISYLTEACRDAGVSIVYNKELRAEELSALHPYALIDATGGTALIPASIPGTDLPIVCTPADILSGRILPKGESVMIVGSGLTGLETAEYLTTLPGTSVMVMEMDPKIAPTAYIASRTDAMGKLLVANVILMPGRQLLAIEEDRVRFLEISSGEERELPVDRVVLSLGVRSVAAYKDLPEGIADHVYTIGDAAKPGRIMEAIHQGYQIGKKL